jgi:DNA-binding MarR family transcriptional regulator
MQANTELKSDRTENLLGAFALALSDAIRESTKTASGHHIAGAAALATVIAYPGDPIDALARTVGLSPAGASRLVDKLENEGLVRREGSRADARSRVIVPTDAGHDRARNLLDARRAAVARALDALSKDQRRQLTQLLEVMLDALTPDRQTCDRTCRLCDVSACPSDICPVELAALAREQGGSPEPSRRA